MNKFTEFVKAKATQIAITAVSASLVISASAGVAIHNNNKKLETALQELSSTSTTESFTGSSSESTADSSTENSSTTTTESSTESTTIIQTTVKNETTATTTEPTGDKTIQYLAEYEKITNEYEKKRAALEQHTLLAPTRKITDNLSDEEISSIHQEHSSAYAQNEKAKDSQKKIKELDEKYNRDITNLKRKYGIIK